MSKDLKDHFYLIGDIKFKNSYKTKYGPRTDMFVRVLKSTEPNVKGLVKCVCWRDVAEFAEARANKLMVMVFFKKIGDEPFKGGTIKKVKAERVDKSNMKEFVAFSTNEQGIYDPFSEG